MKTLDQVILKQKDQQAIRAAADIRRRNFPVEEVILFGSKARGDDDHESDIDLLVLTNRKLTWQERDQLIDSIFPVQLERDVVISLLIIPKDQWEDSEYRILLIHQEIEKDGIAA